MRSLNSLLTLVLVASAACDEDEQTSVSNRGRLDEKERCSLQTEIDARLFGATMVRDCGDLPEMADEAQRTAAAQCLSEAFSAGEAFQWVERSSGIDSSGALAYAWPGSGPVYVLVWDSDPSGGGGNSVGQITEKTCSGLVTRVAALANESRTLYVGCAETPAPANSAPPVVCPPVRPR